MLVDFETALEIDRLRKQRPLLSFASVDLTVLLEDIRVTSFPALTETPRWHFVQSRYLACIVHRGSVGRAANIYVNPILNRGETPVIVFRQVFTHELLHLCIGPREIAGKLENHPPEFWEAESRLSPESQRAWDWLWFNHGAYLIRDERLQCVRVRRNWRESLQRDVRAVPTME